MALNHLSPPYDPPTHKVHFPKCRFCNDDPTVAPNCYCRNVHVEYADLLKVVEPVPETLEDRVIEHVRQCHRNDIKPWQEWQPDAPIDDEEVRDFIDTQSTSWLLGVISDHLESE